MVTLVREQQYHKRKSKVYFFLGRIVKKKKCCCTLWSAHTTHSTWKLCVQNMILVINLKWSQFELTWGTHTNVWLIALLKMYCNSTCPLQNLSNNVVRVVPIKHTMIKCKAKGYLGGCYLLWDWVFNISYICVCVCVCVYVCTPQFFYFFRYQNHLIPFES